MTIYDNLGRLVQKTRPVLEEIGGVSGIRDRYSSYPSSGLTPESLALILKEADAGDMLRQAELFEEMEEKDAHLGSVLGTRKLAVAGLEWEVVPASEEKADEDIASFVKEVLTWAENWDEFLLDALDAIGKGFSVMEIMWEIAEGRVWAKEFKWRHQKKFTFIEKDGMVSLSNRPKLLTDAEPVYGIELPPNKFVIHRYRARSGFTPRGGVLRPCAYMYLFKNYAVKDWVIFAERFAMPMRIGKFNASTTEADRKVLRNAVFNLGSDAAAVISDSTVIELLEQATKGASSDLYERLASFCDRSMSKAVLGHTGSADSTPGKLGSESEARDVRKDILEADSKALGKTIQMQIIRPLVEFNFGTGANMPFFRFIHEEGEDLKSLAETYEMLSRSGFDGIPKSHIHKKFGIPSPEDGEETMKPAAAFPALPFKSFPAKEETCSCGKSHRGMHKEDRVLFVGKGGKYWVSEYMDRIAPSLQGAKDEALKKLETWLNGLDTPPSQSALLGFVQSTLGAEYSKIDKKAVSDIASEIYAWQKLTDLMPGIAESSFGGADVRAIEFLSKIDRYYLSKFIQNPEAESALKSFIEERYLASGEGLFGRGEESIAELKNLLGQKLTELSSGQVQRIVDTAVQRNRNFARTSQMYDAGVPEIEIYEPTQGCDFCREMHGRVIPVGAAYGRMQEHLEMSEAEYEVFLKANQPSLENIEAFVDKSLLPPYHPHCHGMVIKRIAK